MNTAAWLQEKLTTLAKGRETTDDGRVVPYPDDYVLAIHELNDHVGTVRWFLQQRPDGFMQRWGSPSLFTSLVLRALQDVTSAKRPLICLTCRRLFVSSAHQARYCSVRCRHTMNKRTYRKTCGQQKPAAEEEPGDTRQKA